MCTRLTREKDDDKEEATWQEYLANIMRKRGSSWAKLYKACKELSG